MNKGKTPRFLITTAIQENWVSDQPVLFLGEWCKIYSQKASWENLDSLIVPYVWDDRKKYYHEYNFNNILDLGCGKANFTHTLKKKNNRVLGVDIIETCIAMASSKYPDVDFLSATADGFFETNKEQFDLVITSEILSYLEN